MAHCKLSALVKDVVQPVHTTLKMRDTIHDALSFLQKQGIEEKIIYFYVVDDENHLTGIVPARKLLLSPPLKRVEEVMERAVIHVLEDEKLEKAFEIFHRHNLLALPVLDKEGHLLGSIDVENCLDESFDIAKACQREDAFQLMGLSLEEKASLWRKYLLRMPWIICNILGGLLCAFISYHYEAVFSKTLVLVIFIPLVLSLSEAISMQLMAQSLFYVRRNKAPRFSIFLRPFKEFKLIFFMAATTGVFVGCISLLEGSLITSLAIALGIMASVCLTSVLGAFLPLLLHRVALDPKIASGPIVLMFSDVLTMVIYLSLAKYLVF